MQLLYTLQDEIQQELQSEELEEFRKVLDRYKEIAAAEKLEHIGIKHILKNSRYIVTTINRVAFDHGVDLIILGTKGASTFKEVFLGSVAAEVLENAHCPVLAIPEKAVFDGEINVFAVTTSFISGEKPVLHKVIEFAKLFNAEVHCINVDLDHVQRYRMDLKNFKKDFTYYDKLEFHILDGTDLFSTLTGFIQEKKVDIVAMLTTRRNFIQELFHYSKAKHMSHHHDIPILAIQAHFLEEQQDK